MAEFIYILYYSKAHVVGNTNIVFVHSLLRVLDIKVKYKIRIIMQSFTLKRAWASYVNNVHGDGKSLYSSAFAFLLFVVSCSSV